MTINKFAVGMLGAVVFALALVFAVAPTTHAQEWGDESGVSGVEDCGDCGGGWGDDSGLNDCDIYGCDSDDFGCDDWGCDMDSGDYEGNDFCNSTCGGGSNGGGSGCSSCGGGGYGGGSWGGVITTPSHSGSVTNVNNNYNTNQNQNVNNVNVNVGSTDNDDNYDDNNDRDYDRKDKKEKKRREVVVYNQPPQYPPYVTLTQVPYTGLELGFWGTIAYWGFLVLWCLLAAYLIVVKKVHTRWAQRIKVFLFGDESEVSHPAYMQVENPLFATASAAVAPQISTLAEVHNAPVETTDEVADNTDPFILSQINRYN